MNKMSKILVGIFITLCGMFFVAPHAGATAEFYWDDGQSTENTEQGMEDIMVKSDFFLNQPAQEGKKPANSARFRLVRTTRDLYKFETVDAFTVNTSYTNLADGTVTCSIKKMSFELDVSQNPDKPSNMKIADASVSVTGGSSWLSWANGFAEFVANKLDACKDMFNQTSRGATNIFVGGQLRDLIKDLLADSNKVENKFGESASLSSLENMLARMKKRESTHFVHRVCGTSSMPAVPRNAIQAASTQYNLSPGSCADEAKKAYDKIWNVCEEAAKTQTDNEARVEQIKKCISDYSGVAINGDKLDSTVFREITYADGESCSIKYIGWIICPTSRFLANLTDTAFEYLQRFFTISPLNRGQPAGDALYQAWQLINSIANVIFIAAFLIIMFSQVTSRGLERYGIKKLFPRLILTAVLVNASYFICVTAVDISNILGDGLFRLFDFLEPGAVNKPSTWSQEVENILVFTTAAVGTGAVVLTASLVALFPLLIGAAISLLIALIMIIARYAIILILIIIAPVALACMLLPNTQKWWSQWMKIFMSMLMLYPLVAIVFGASKVAGIVILNSSLARHTGDITLQLFGLAIQVVPLALTPVLMRLSGGILNRFGARVSSNGLFKKARTGADNFAQRKRNARDVEGLRATGANARKGLTGARDKVIQSRYRRKAKHASNQDAHNSAYANYKSGYIAGSSGVGGDKTSLLERAKGRAFENYTPKTQGEKFAKDLAKGGGSLDVVRSDALNAQMNIRTDIVKAEKAGLPRNMDEVADIAQGKVAAVSDETRQAAIELVMEGGSAQQINDVVKSAKGMTSHQRQATAHGVSSSRVQSQAAYYKSPDAQRAILNGDVSDDDSFTEHIVAPSLNQNLMSAADIGSMHSDSLGEVHKALGSDKVSSAAKTSAANSASRALSSSDIKSTMHSGGDAERILTDIANRRPRP